MFSHKGNILHPHTNINIISDCPSGNRWKLGIIVALGSFGVAFSIFGVSVCKFAIVVFPIGTASGIIGVRGEIGLGIFNREGNGNYWAYLDDLIEKSNGFPFECVKYKESERSALSDGAWKASSAMAVISIILGVVATIVAFSATCLSRKSAFFKALGGLFIASGVFASLSFVWFANGICSLYECRYSTAAATMTVACVVFVASGICSLFVIPTIGQPIEEPDTVIVTETNRPDDTRSIRGTTAHEVKSMTMEDAEESTIQAMAARPSITTSQNSNEISHEVYDQGQVSTEEGKAYGKSP